MYLSLLDKFAASAASTPWRDVRTLGEWLKFDVKIYLALDPEDEYLQSESKVAEGVFNRHNIINITRVNTKIPHSQAQELWRQCAFEAWKDGRDYMVFLNNDSELMDEGWMRLIHSIFSDMSAASKTAHGLGCVSFTNTTPSSGTPLFPIIQRTHMDVFDGRVVPDSSINQESTPFLAQLYSRYGTYAHVPCRVRNMLTAKEHALRNPNVVSIQTVSVL